MTLSVIIVNYNVRQFLENALSSLLTAMEGISGEIFVVDNASDDGSVEMVRDKFPGVSLIENRSNLGFARANNMALARARGEYLLLINPDTIVQEDTLRVMIAFLQEHPEAGLAGCRILNPDGTLQLACRRSFPTPWVAFTKIAGLSALFPRSRIFGRYNLTYLDPDRTSEVEAISGSMMMISRAAYEKVGGLDETFFMYGEDLDWCYRIREAGFRVYYVSGTTIIHYKGESTKRSEIDEIRVFYHAMQQFVEKHFSRSAAVELILTTGILLRASIAAAARLVRPMVIAAVDFVLVDAALILGEYLYFGHLFHFRQDAYPIIWSVPALVVIMSLALAGGYTNRRYAVARSGMAVIVAYVLLSAIVFFAKDFAFSRAVVLIAGVLSLVFIPGWRLVVQVGGRVGRGGRGSLFGRRTLIVGTGASSQELLRRLRHRVDGGYEVLGFIDVTRRRIGERIAGIEILGSIDTIGRVIAERRVSEVIFSTDGLTYADILSVIARSGGGGVSFRLVPNSMEAIVGKTSVDRIDPLPLIEIDYNIQKPLNRSVKRLLDLALSAALLVTVYPWLRITTSARTEGGKAPVLLLLPHVFSGRLSMVGRPLDGPDAPEGYLGKRGLTGLVQINAREGLSAEEAERYSVYYARNQSFLLDVEILIKTLLMSKN